MNVTNIETKVIEVVVTARPSWARVKKLIEEYVTINGHQSIRLSLVGPAISQRYGDISTQLPKWLNFKTFIALHESDTLDAVALSALEGASALVRHWAQNRPSAVLVIADRTETLGVSIAAAIMQIPLIHLQGGEVSGSIDHKIRNANSKLADFHLTTNQYTAKNIINLGEDPENIKIVGCPSIDLVNDVIQNINFQIEDSSDIIGVGKDFSLAEPYGVIMFHPDTVNETENAIWVEEISNLVDESKINWFWFWPNPDHGTNIISKFLRRRREQSYLQNVKFIINVEPEIFIKLACGSQILIGNSSFGIREASFIGLPVLNLGRRQDGRQKADNVTDIELQNKKFLFAAYKKYCGMKFPSSNLYGSGNSGQLCAKALSEWTPTTKLKK